MQSRSSPFRIPLRSSENISETPRHPRYWITVANRRKYGKWICLNLCFGWFSFFRQNWCQNQAELKIMTSSEHPFERLLQVLFIPVIDFAITDHKQFRSIKGGTSKWSHTIHTWPYASSNNLRYGDMKSSKDLWCRRWFCHMKRRSLSEDFKHGNLIMWPLCLWLTHNFAENRRVKSPRHLGMMLLMMDRGMSS